MHNMQWYDWHTVTERLQGRAYALTRGRPYKVILDPNTPTGCCDFTSKKILINPNLFTDYLQKMGLTGSKLDKANFLISRAVTGHEALHVLYSDPAVVMEAINESPVLKTVLNLLEDARIERIGSESSHVSKTLFAFVNGIAKTQLQAVDPSTISILDLLLRWRLGAKIPALKNDIGTVWSQVAGLANQALYAMDCRVVLNLSKDIVRIAGLESHQMPESQSIFDKMQSDVVGNRDSAPMSNPIKQPSGESNKSEKHDSGADDNNSPESNDSKRYAGNDEADDTGSEDSEQPDESTSGESGASDDDFPEEKSSVQDNDDILNEESDSEFVHLVQEEADAAADIARLVQDTAQQVSEDLDSLVPKDDIDNPLVAKSTPFRGRKYSDIEAAPYAHYLSEAAPIAAELIRDLKADGPKAVSGPGEYPGRFKSRYYLRDNQKPFALQKYQGLTVPKMALSLVIDRSGSMESIVQELRTMSMAIAMACESLKIPLSIWALEGQVHVKKFDERGPQVLAKIAGISANTLTRVMPTINDVVNNLKNRPEELKQIVLIHDGMPSDGGDFIRWRNELRGIGLFCLFIMKEEEYQFYKDAPQSLRERMDELVGPRNYAVAPVSELARHWCSFIRNARNLRSQLAV